VSAGIEVRCVEVGHIYQVDGSDAVALVNVGVEIAAGESIALFGPSGSGKSTLLSLLAGLRRPTVGEIWLGQHHELATMSERRLLALRGRDIAVVVQNPSRSLLPYGTAEDNIRFARRALARRQRASLEDPRELLRRLGLAELAGQPVARLSGGEQQRLSVAVAMASTARLLLADEPTSQLDSHNRDLVVELLTRVREEFGTTLAVVTHDPVVADAMQRRVTLAEGHVVPARHPQSRWGP
jgi:putative ABC transport system ATP-binding protein